MKIITLSDLEFPMPYTPSPDEANHALFFIRWWKEFFLGAAAFAGIIATVRKGQKTPIVAAMTEAQIDVKLLKGRDELHTEITGEFKVALQEHERRMALLIENAILRAQRGTGNANAGSKN